MRHLAILPLLLLAACHGHGEGDDPVEAQGKHRTNFTGIAPTETLHFAGAKQAWSGSVAGDTLTYVAPGKTEAVTVPVQRFTGNNGLAFSGTLDGATLDLAVTAAPCSEDMSTTPRPFAVTLRIGAEKREGCGWTDKHEVAQAAAH